MPISYAIARSAPIGVVIAEYAARLSRMWIWDLEKDTFTPGQFLKGRAYVSDMSADGRYVVYYALAYQRPEEAFIAVSHPPHFTALGCFPTSPISGEAFFLRDGSLCVRTRQIIASWRGQTELLHDRIEPMCPFEIIREVDDNIVVTRNWSNDLPRSRHISVEGYDLVATDNQTSYRRLLASFPREPFQPIEPPDWARRW